MKSIWGGFDMKYIVALDQGTTSSRAVVFDGKGRMVASHNIEFAQILGDGNIRVRVWERGSGITMACGTGACATAVAAFMESRAGRSSRIIMDGGELEIEWRETDNHVYMSGPAEFVFDGDIELLQ